MESMVIWVKELYEIIDMLKREIGKLKEENRKLKEENESVEYLRMQRDGLHVCAKLPYSTELWIEGSLLKFMIRDKGEAKLIKIKHTDKFDALRTARDILARIEIGNYEVLD